MGVAILVFTGSGIQPFLGLCDPDSGADISIRGRYMPGNETQNGGRWLLICTSGSGVNMSPPPRPMHQLTKFKHYGAMHVITVRVGGALSRSAVKYHDNELAKPSKSTRVQEHGVIWTLTQQDDVRKVNVREPASRRHCTLCVVHWGSHRTVNKQLRHWSVLASRYTQSRW